MILAIIITVLIVFGLFWFIDKMNVPLSEKAKAELKKEKKRIFNTKEFNTKEFKANKKISDGDTVDLFQIPNSLKVNIYERNSFGGEGYLHKIYDKQIWKAVEENRIISAKIHRTDKNKAYTKIIFR